jgi:hypothetical protein
MADHLAEAEIFEEPARAALLRHFSLLAPASRIKPKIGHPFWGNWLRNRR